MRFGAHPVDGAAPREFVFILHRAETVTWFHGVSAIRDPNLSVYRQARGNGLRKITFQALMLDWTMCSCRYFYFKNIFKKKLAHVCRRRKCTRENNSIFCFPLFNLFISRCSSSVSSPFAFPPLFLYPSLSSSVKRRGWRDRGREGGREGGMYACVCASVCV